MGLYDAILLACAAEWCCRLRCGVFLGNSFMGYDSPPQMAAKVPAGYVTVGSIPSNGGEFETCFARKIR